MSDFTKHLWKHFWFLRGILAAITVAGLVPQFTDLSRFEFLAAFHALIVGWQAVTHWIAEQINTLLPFNFHIDREYVSAFLFATAAAMPAGYYAGTRPGTRRLATRMGAFSILASPWLLALIATAMAFWAYLQFSLTDIFQFLNSLFYTSHTPIEWVQFLIGYGVATFALATWCYALIDLQGYARGIIMVITFVVAMQILYYLDAPWFADAIRTLSGQPVTPPT